MNTRLYLFTAALAGMTGLSYYASAQDETDALRYSFLSSQGTARSIGFGGALGSIGGDVSSLSVNPAGIGIYRSSEFTFTPSIRINSTQSSYTGQTTNDNNARFSISNLGLVLTSASEGKRYAKSKWKAVAFGIGINRVADFNRNYTYKGFNNTSSGAEVFGIDAINYPSDVQNTSTLAGLGYQSYLIDTFYDPDKGNQLNYVTASNWNTGLNQQRTVKENGGISDINISLGGNYMEKLMLGATLGIPSVVYKRDVTYTETDATNNNNNNFDFFTYHETLTTRGSGINLKLGAIYKVNDYFRFGAALHTPTYYHLKDIQNRSLTANTENKKQQLGVNDGPTTRVDAPENTYEYNLLTPWKAVLSASGILGKHGFITADYEYIDYASARFDFDGNNTTYETYINQLIKSSYTGASNFRLGAEGKFGSFMVRLGVGYYGSPYKKSYANAERLDVSGGIGFRAEGWFLDLGYVRTMYSTQEYPYTLNHPYVGIVAVPQATTNNMLNNFAVTFGTKF